MTLVLGSVNPVAIPGHWTQAKASDRENLDGESSVLTLCRPTKRGDELKEVVLPKIIQ
tara:strand:+ start:349 stop:522 length:174 start_codon:yes stop_codon:yes gene_type:complete